MAAAPRLVQCSKWRGRERGPGRRRETPKRCRRTCDIFINVVAHIQSASGKPGDLTEMNSSLIDDGCAGCSISHPAQPPAAHLQHPSQRALPSSSVRLGRSRARAGQGVIVTSEKCATSTRRGAATQSSLSLSLSVPHMCRCRHRHRLSMIYGHRYVRQ